jgi:chromosome segregation ATPase
MQKKTKYCLLILGIAVITVPGCALQNEPEELQARSDLPQSWQSDAFAQRFQEATPKNPTVVESAIELSDRYAKLSEEASVLRQQNRNLTSRNEQLREQTADIENRLKQTQKELSEANQVLVDMRVELNNWKADVLGFREEMRSAQTAQLQALLKIMKVLGADSNIETTRSNAIGQAVASAKN